MSKRKADYVTETIDVCATQLRRDKPEAVKRILRRLVLQACAMMDDNVVYSSSGELHDKERAKRIAKELIP